ncbi:MAG: RNA polymerase sigma factor [Acidobacteria bacterium]|nr:RNA polymerase sigma factor [Acidobacteriota bacterium]
MASQTDDQLMMEVRTGAVSQFAVLFERHHRALFRFFSLSAGSSTLAEDLTQEVFFRMLRFRETFQSGARFTPWMYQIARNVHFDHLRKRQHEMPLFDDREGRDFDAADPDASAERKLMRASDLATLRKALQRLPADKRELLVLCRWQNLTYEQIGEILQCDPAAVKSRVFRTMKLLGEIFHRLAGRQAS